MPVKQRLQAERGRVVEGGRCIASERAPGSRGSDAADSVLLKKIKKIRRFKWFIAQRPRFSNIGTGAAEAAWLWSPDGKFREPLVRPEGTAVKSPSDTAEGLPNVQNWPE